MNSIFAYGPRLYRKTYPLFPPPHFSLLVSLTYAKTQCFSCWHPFQTKFLFFQTLESAKRAFAAREVSGKPAFFHALFLENEKQNSRKNYGAIFSLEVQGHMQKFSSFKGRKRTTKMQLMLLMQAALQYMFNFLQ